MSSDMAEDILLISQSASALADAACRVRQTSAEAGELGAKDGEGQTVNVYSLLGTEAAAMAQLAGQMREAYAAEMAASVDEDEAREESA